MLNFLATLLATVPSILRSRAALELENLALRHQIGVLQGSAKKRVKLTRLDGLLWVWLSRIWSDWYFLFAWGGNNTSYKTVYMVPALLGRSARPSLF